MLHWIMAFAVSARDQLRHTHVRLLCAPLMDATMVMSNPVDCTTSCTESSKSAPKQNSPCYQDLGVMEAILPAADMQRWVAARSKPKYAALMMTQIVRHAQVGWLVEIPTQPLHNANMSIVYLLSCLMTTCASQHGLVARCKQDRNVLSGCVSGSCDARISSMLTALGSCTRIKHTPMPFAYIVHLR